jgi:hypothetical protein
MMTSKILATPATFNRFLYAGVGDDKNGMELTLLSALARQNRDPWQEAADLSRLPAETAVRTLAVMLELLPGQAPLAERTALAGRLVSLLPHPAEIRPRGTHTPRVAPPVERSERASGLAMLVIYAVAMFAGSWWFSNHSGSDSAAQPVAESAPVAAVAPVAAGGAPPSPQRQ